MKKDKVNPFFRIKKEGLRTDSGVRIPKRYALLNARTNTLLGIMSNEYEVILNSQVARLFDDALKSYKVLKSTDHLDALQRKWKRQLVLNVPFSVERGDKVVPMIEIFNGYDIRSGFGYEVLACRLLSESSFVINKRGMYRESYYHFSNNPKKLQTSIETKFDDLKKYVSVWSTWSKQKATKDDFIRFVEGRKYLSRKIQEEIIDSFDATKNKFSEKDTRWGHFNILTCIATYETKARKGSNIFSHRYRLLEKMIEDYYRYDVELRMEHGVIG